MTASAGGEPAGAGESYDYVVVGSGAGGGPVAANLARAGMRVLVLEAGGDDEGLDYQVPCFHGRSTENEALRWDFWVRHYSDDAQSARDSKFDAQHDGVLYPRSGTLGGCTAHNAMITIYPHNADWDAIARITGDDSWSAAAMRQYFERLERCEYVDPPKPLPARRRLRRLVLALPLWNRRYKNLGRHGWNGWLGTSLVDPKLAFTDWAIVRMVLRAGKETLGDHLGRRLKAFEDFDKLRDPNDARAESEGMLGLWSTPQAVSAGRRNGTRELLRGVEAEHPDRLTIRLHALATKVVLDDDNRAVGIEYVEGPSLYRADPRANGRPGVPRRVYAEREVILAGGAFNSPQLLMLSGIGPREELERHGIPVRVERPGVGRNLQDRYEVGVIHEMKRDFELLEGCNFEPPDPGEEPDRCLREWQRNGGGLYASNGVVVAIARRSGEEQQIPDLIIFGVPAYFRGYYRGYSREISRGKRFFTWAILKAHTRNVGGWVRLRSADPLDPPHVNFRYFEEGTDTEGADLEAMLTGVKFVRSLMGKLDEIVEQELVPGPKYASDDDVRRFVRDEAWGHHATCTCKIGAPDDPEAVLDSNFRVYGTKGLRVVDASVFPAIPGFFVVTSIYMIGEKASDAILADARVPAPA